MRKILLTLLLTGLAAHTLSGQTLLQQIEDRYRSLDSAAYLEEIKLAYRDDLEERFEEEAEFLMELGTYYSREELERYNDLKLRKWCNEFDEELDSQTPIYVLNLLLEKSPDGQIRFLPDTNKLSFHLYYFDEHFKMVNHVVVDEGEYAGHGPYIMTFSRKFARRTFKVLRKILLKNPKYLLECSSDGNLFFYVLNDKIYVYRILQMKEYELGNYVKTFLGADIVL
ncbi:MAG: hypothetical protein LBM20_00760 [Rikenellaceae bacterium]|jgi:hypothetical protein|nr:hypothetical protein [Rikenellaceae bacterium]